MSTVTRFLVALVIAALAAMFAVSINGCVTMDPPKDNPDATAEQMVAAAMYDGAAFNRAAAQAFRAAYPKSPATACAALKAALAISDRNHAKISAAREALESGDPSASADWLAVLDIVLTGFETAQVVIDGRANAEAVLRPGISEEEIDSRYERASSNYDTALHMITVARQDCGDG